MIYGGTPMENEERVFGNTEVGTSLDERTMATLSAVKGKQFGKDIYSSVIKFEDLDNFLTIFPEVQRDIMKRKVASLRRYILSGLDKDNGVNMRFFSAVTVTCKGNIFYSENQHRMGIDIYNSKLSINDGQHRFEAIRTAIQYLEKEFVRSKDKHKTARIKAWLEELKNMVVPVVIFDGLSQREEKMLFHDLNNLAQRPSRNANIRLNQTDEIAKMARELAHEHRYLTHYGVEMDKMSIHGNNNNTILLTTVYASIRELLDSEYKNNKNFLTDDNYGYYKKHIRETYDKLFFALPADIDVRGKYIIEKSFTLKAISRFISHARNHLDLQLDDNQIFDTISSIDWSYNLDVWGQYGGFHGADGNNIVFGGGTNGGFKAVYNILIDRATNAYLSVKKRREDSERELEASDTRA